MGKPWSDAAIRSLTNWAVCPRCDRPFQGGVCVYCGADPTGPEGLALAEASRAAVAALEAREQALAALPTRRPVAVQPMAAPAYPTAAAPRPQAPALAHDRPSSQLSLQSVLAVAGAGLFAVAAIVFTFFNEALTDLTTRSLVVGIISIVFLGAAWLLARARLGFSAEAVGALAMVFVVLDIWAIASQPHGLNDYAVAAVATLVISLLMVLLARIRGLRTWLWSGLVGLALTPLFFGLALETAASTTLGWLGVGFLALAAHELVRRLAPRFDSALRTDHATLTSLQGLAVLGAGVVAITITTDTEAQKVFVLSAVLAAITVLALLSARNGLSMLWSFGAGLAATLAVMILPFSATYADERWLFAILPAAASGALAIIAALVTLIKQPEHPVLSRIALLGGALTITAFASAPAFLYGSLQLITLGSSFVEPIASTAAVLGIAATALGVLAVAASQRSVGLASVALWIGLFAGITLATWTGFTPEARVAIALIAAVALVPVAVSTPPLRVARSMFRVPLFAAAHVLVVLAAALSIRGDATLGIIGGIGVTIAIAALAIAMPRTAKPFYAAVAFAYGLGVFAYTLIELTSLDGFQVLSLTATLGLVIALAVTLVRVVPTDFWYASLAVAAVPALLAVLSLLLRINGWAGLPTAVALPLLVAMTVMHRQGLRRELRALAAALIVPAISTVIISVVAEVALRSAAPITLPIVAGLVALTLPLTDLVGRGLTKLGHSAEDSSAVRLALEISALVTGGIAVILTIARTAAGPETTFLVLAIIGLGATATGFFVGRRYAWYVAYISFTGALWSLLALNSVRDLEPYVLPPALAAAALGVLAAARGRNGLGFYAGGLGVAVATSLYVLLVEGNSGAPFEARTYALLAAAVVLVVVGWLLGTAGERLKRLGQLRSATLLIAMGTALAGVLQALRYSVVADVSGFSGQSVMWPVLYFSALATIIATAAALLLTSSSRLAASRWLFVPAMGYLVLAPITAFRRGELYSWTHWVLMLVLLTVMLYTVVRARRGPVALPYVWVTFAIATITAIAGWSEHSVFRVEGYSLPLGLALLAAGIIAWRPVDNAVATVNRWPIGFSGSWWLLAPGIAIVLGISIMSTLTDPMAVRAVLVIALALTAILLGNRLRLAGPFFLGIAALPLEILAVFAVQAGGKIPATTWWITLASAGALLLVLAVSSERRASGEGGIAARVRDLR
jgi:hypothetical protein